MRACSNVLALKQKLSLEKSDLQVACFEKVKKDWNSYLLECPRGQLVSKGTVKPLSCRRLDLRAFGRNSMTRAALVCDLIFPVGVESAMITLRCHKFWLDQGTWSLRKTLWISALERGIADSAKIKSNRGHLQSLPLLLVDFFSQVN